MARSADKLIFSSDSPGPRTGTATIELALVAPLLLVLLFAIIEFGLLFKDLIVLKNAVREGVRQAAVSGSTSLVHDRVIDTAAGLNGDNISVTQECGTYNEGSWSWRSLGDEVQAGNVVNDAPVGSYVRISASYPHSLVAAGLVPGLEDEVGSGAINIAAITVMRRE